MELEVALKMGFLYIPPQHFLRVVFRKTWIKKYCALYCASNHGIQRIEIFETEDAFTKLCPSKIVPLTDCWKVTPLPQKNQPNVFEVRTKSSTYQYSTETFQEMSEWLIALQTAAFNITQTKTSPALALSNEEKQEENLLYCSMDEPEVYAVNAIATEAVLRNNLQGDYKLIITRVNFSLSEENSQGRIGKVILTWPYRHIRRYGCSPETFSFEAGRKCSSGEGLFTFATTDGSKIFQSIDSHVSALKSTQGESIIPNSPSIKEDKNNCFTSRDSLKNEELNMSQNLSNSNLSFSVDTNSEFSNAKSSFKPIPPFKKPPRKSKSGLYDQNLENTSGNKVPAQDSPNQYAEISRVDSYETFVKHPEKSFYCSKYSDEFSDIPQQSFHSDNISSGIEDMRLTDAAQNLVTMQPGSNLDYENFTPTLKMTPQSYRSTSASEHVYGKLSTKKSKPTEYLYGSIITKPSATSKIDASPIYSNVPFVNQSQSNDTDEIDNDNDPQHFTKNDTEYAQVFKKNKHLS